jgi:choline kinase
MISKEYNDLNARFYYVIDNCSKGSLYSFFLTKEDIVLPVLLMDSDIIFLPCALVEMINQVEYLLKLFLSAYAFVAIVNTENPLNKKYVKIDLNGRVLGFSKKENNKYIAGGMIYIYLESPFSYCNAILDKNIYSYSYYFNYLVNHKNIYSVNISNLWNVNTYNDIIISENIIKNFKDFSKNGLIKR